MTAVSIVTPSYNSGAYLEECIQSVLAQDYPDIEYIVIDGGSTDETPAILSRYADRIDRIVSRPDSGQAQAINDGFKLAGGEIFAYLNADDTYLPGAISTAVAAFEKHPDSAVVYGNGYHVLGDGSTVAPYPTMRFDPQGFRHRCYICQPAAFIRSDAFREIGGMNPDLHYSLDYDLWIRLAQMYRFTYIEPFLATSRMHAANKSFANRKLIYREVFETLKRHYSYIPYEWVYGYASYLCDGNDQLEGPSKPSFLKLLLSLGLGAYYNRRRMPDYFVDWFAHRAIGATFLRSRA